MKRMNEWGEWVDVDEWTGRDLYLDSCAVRSQGLHGPVVKMVFERGTIVCTYPGSWLEPPAYEPDPFEILTVRVRDKVQGKRRREA